MGSRQLTAIMAKAKKARESAKNPLDRFSTERGRGRPLKVVPSAVVGRADNYRGILPRIWDALETPLLMARTEDDVIKAFQIAQPGGHEFPSLAALILKVVGDRQFPKRQKARINFLADSLGGIGLVTPRRSRDICAEERAAKEEAKRAPYIIRYEYYVECSCGYRGHSVNHACRKCGAEIVFPVNLGSNIF
jgi:hypothetical protein